MVSIQRRETNNNNNNKAWRSTTNSVVISHVLAFLVGTLATIMMSTYQQDDGLTGTLRSTMEGLISLNSTQTRNSNNYGGGAPSSLLGQVVDDRSVAQRSFFEIAQKAGTDKVRGTATLPVCVAEGKCQRPEAVNRGCKVTGHFYDSIYQRWLGPYSTDTVEPFQFLEIGYFNGKGFDAYTEFLPRAEKHSMEIACLPHGPRKEGKWPWGNFAEKNPRYRELVEANRLHCGDASDYAFLIETWTKHMKRPDAPPLRVVIDDAAHLSEHMATSVFFWFPRIQPGGLMFVEDIEPQTPANQFRTQFLPQLVKDLHYCGLPDEKNTQLCFPTIQPFLKSISCELHVCVLERNDVPATEPDEQSSTMPKNALNAAMCQG